MELFLENNEFDEAVGYCERVLDSEPENAWAYLYRLRGQLKLNNTNDLLNVKTLKAQKSFKLANRFADADLQRILQDIMYRCEAARNELAKRKQTKEAEAKRQAEKLNAAPMPKPPANAPQKPYGARKEKPAVKPKPDGRSKKLNAVPKLNGRLQKNSARPMQQPLHLKHCLHTMQQQSSKRTPVNGLST